MSDLTQEQFDQVPEFLKTDYVKVGDVYQHNSVGKVSSLKKSLDDLDTKVKGIEATKAAEIEAARKDALEKARSKGDVEAIEKRYQEQMQDLEKRTGETLKQYEERIGKMSATAKKGGIDSIVAALSPMATKDGKAAFDRLIRQYVDYDPETGKNTFLNDDGSASSLDLEAFKKELPKNPLFAPLIAAEFTTTGGGNASGGAGNGGRASQNDSKAKEEAAKKSGDLNGFLNLRLTQ